jgi:hypothetical protein
MLIGTAGRVIRRLSRRRDADRENVHSNSRVGAERICRARCGACVTRLDRGPRRSLHLQHWAPAALGEYWSVMRWKRNILVTSSTLALGLSIGIAALVRRSLNNPHFWLRETEAAPHQLGDHGEARFFRGYFLSQGRFGWSQVRLTRGTEFGWPFRRQAPEDPSQDVLLRSIAPSGAGGAWSILLWPFAVGFALYPLTTAGIWFARSARVNHRKAHGMCRHCGYDLRATPTQCPECGMTTEPAIAG